MKELYKLRRNFAIIGLTGRSGAGCSQVAAKLESRNYIEELSSTLLVDSESKDLIEIKFNICMKYLSFEDNWEPFKVIKYSSVLLLHLLHQACFEKDLSDSRDSLFDLITSFRGESTRFNSEDDIKSIISDFLDHELHFSFAEFKCHDILDCLKGKESNTIVNIFFKQISIKTEGFFNRLKEYDFYKTKLLLQDLAVSLRSYGRISSLINKPQIGCTYTVAETINRIIKAFRKSTDGHGRVVIDSLKNSLELTYFKEKYSGFYCLAINRTTAEREAYIKGKCTKFFKSGKEAFLANQKIDDTEYKGGEFNKGEFSSPDIENCIQKSDFHIFWVKNFIEEINRGEKPNEVCLDRQLVKFIALLYQPGIITPTSQERTMQIAFNAKANSGCISRQVGAVITDASHSVKAIGWNDVPMYQTPCNLRSLTDLVEGKNQDNFSDFEKGKTTYPDGESFIDKIKSVLPVDLEEKLQGRSCSFCFKTCHNSFEGEKNQVHTRSLHAEENAMLQITKYGGQGVKGGYLYTTASPCELCSKKAFQIGIRTIYFIDPYPGIATTHVLKNSYNKEKIPRLLMFRGAVGRGFHKLYESFMSYKDELNIRAEVHPKMDQGKVVEKLTKDKSKQLEILSILNK